MIRMLFILASLSFIAPFGPLSTASAAETAAVSPAHARLDPLVGRWAAVTRSRTKPGAEPAVSTGMVTLSWILAGRFLQEDFMGTMDGKPFHGLGFTGYDDLRKEYETVWIEDVSNAFFESTGRFDDATKTLKASGRYSDHSTGEKHRWFRDEWKLPEGDRSVYSMYLKDSSGKEFKSMEIVYTRAE